MIGGTQQFTAVDNLGIPRTDATWTVSNTSVATVTTNANGTAVVTGLAAGQVTLTASAESVTAQEQVTVLSQSSFPTGTTIWSAPPPAGYSVVQLAQAVPSANGPDLYSISTSADGTQSIIQALQADGEQLWQAPTPPVTSTSVPDAFGGLIVTTCASGKPMTIVDLNATGQTLWQQAAAGVNGQGYICYPAPVAVRGDGVAFIAEPTNAGLPSLTVAYPNGYIQAIQFPPSTVTTNGNTIQVTCCVGPPMVNTDGTVYLEYEVRNTNNNVITSDVLYLYSSVANAIVLSTTTQDEALLPGPIIPDGNGGILVTWTISPSHSVLQYPYQAADVTNGVVAAPYNLPFSPPSVAFGQSPTLVLGESGVAFASGQTTAVDGVTQVSQIASFNLTSGSTNWTYQAPQGSTLSIIAAASGNGLAAKTTSQNSIDTVVRFSPTGTVTTDSWNGTQVAYYIGTLWTGTASNNSAVAYAAPPVLLSSSAWFQPEGGGQGNKSAIPALKVTSFSTTGANQSTTQNVLNKIVTALALQANSACANWLVAPPPPGGGSGTTGSSYIQAMLQNTAFGHGVFNNITTWAFTGNVTSLGLPAGIAMVINDSAGFYNATAPSGGSYVWGPSKFIYTEFDTAAGTPILKPPQYPGGSLKAQVATLIHETAHGVGVEFFQTDSGIQKAGYFNDQFLYQNCHALIDGIQ